LRLTILFALLAFVALAIETAVPYWFPLRIFVPNLIVILAVDLGLRHHGAIPALLAFAMGYATDAFAGTMLGLNAMLTTIVYLMAYGVSSRLMVTTALVGAVMVFLGVLLTTLGGLVLSSGVSALSQASELFPRFLTEAAISAVIAPAVFALLGGLKRLTGLPVGPERE
jgi:rod shape-determining protein MreD